nr:glycosyltransferase [uncultured Mucilaginibacter sp.]
MSPFFPPCNAADMQRVRMSLPYFIDFGWQAEVVMVDERYSDMIKDELLTKSLPVDLKIHKVKALSKGITSKFGLGGLALRSIWFYKQKVDQLLKKEKFDLIYFSTTQFPVCILGAYWKKKFGVPYVIDMQDPWHSEYYKAKPKNERPPKYWFSYRLNKYLEPIAMRHVDGLISVSESYITDLKTRYTKIASIPSSVITFGYFEPDMDIALKNRDKFSSLLSPGCKNLVYVGRGGMDMQKAVKPVFHALKQFITSYPEARLKLYFIGTSYAPAGTGIATILPLAKQMGVEDSVIEITDRITYYHALVTLQQADALFIPGSDDPNYTASKIYPYLLAKKPLLAIFNPKSPALNELKLCGAQYAYGYDDAPELDKNLHRFFLKLMNDSFDPTEYDTQQLKQFSAQQMTKKQCQLFNQVVQ